MLCVGEAVVPGGTHKPIEPAGEILVDGGFAVFASYTLSKDTSELVESRSKLLWTEGARDVFHVGVFFFGAAEDEGEAFSFGVLIDVDVVVVPAFAFITFGDPLSTAALIATATAEGDGGCLVFLGGGGGGGRGDDGDEDEGQEEGTGGMNDCPSPYSTSSRHLTVLTVVMLIDLSRRATPAVGSGGHATACCGVCVRFERRMGKGDDDDDDERSTKGSTTSALVQITLRNGGLPASAPYCVVVVCV
eukprot:evm.model.NODE_40914_length_11324_cov_16.040358.1